MSDSLALIVVWDFNRFRCLQFCRGQL